MINLLTSNLERLIESKLCTLLCHISWACDAVNSCQSSNMNIAYFTQCFQTSYAWAIIYALSQKLYNDVETV